MDEELRGKARSHVKIGDFERPRLDHTLYLEPDRPPDTIGMDPEEFEWLGAMMEYLGEEKATKLLRGLARQEIRWHKGHTRLAQFMAAGEFALSLSYAHRIEDLKKKGAPVDWSRTTKPLASSSFSAYFGFRLRRSASPDDGA